MIVQPATTVLMVAVPYLVLAAVAFTISREPRVHPVWEWLCAFGGLFGLYLYIPLGLMVPGLAHPDWVSSLLIGLAYLSLLEFARLKDGRSEMFPRWVTLVAFLVLMAMILSGIGDKPWLVSLVLGIPSGTLVFVMLLAYRGELSGLGRIWVLLLALSFLLVPVAAVVGVYPAYGNQGQNSTLLAVGILAVVASVFLDAWHVHDRSGAGAVLHRLANVAAVGLVLAMVVTAGIIVTRLLAEIELQELRSNACQQDIRIAMTINQTHAISEQVVETMSGSPSLLRRCTDDSPESIADANSVLDRYARSFNADVAYLIDIRGVVLASSNRDRPDSLIGANLAGREHFRRASAGERYSLVALGAITHTRGLYAAAPVRDASGQIRGVAAIKSDLESLERQLGNQGHIALVDPLGLVWLATERNWTYQRMWNRVTLPALPAPIVAPRLGANELRRLPDHPLRTGEMVTLDGEPHEVNRTTAGLEGWSLISFVPVQPVIRSQAIALLATVCVIVIVLAVASSVRLFSRYIAGQQQQLALSASLKEMERVMSVLSHDLRTPLTSAHSSAEYLLMLPEIQGEAREAAIMIADEQMRMSELVTRLLDAMRIRNGMMHWSWERVAVHDLLERVRRTIVSLPTLRSEVHVDLDCTEAPESILGDAQAITRLVTNLATNAIRHTKQGSVQIKARTQETDAVQWLMIEIIDTGDGIAPDILPLLGRPFVLGAKQGGAGGSGLGLAIAVGICAAHGGKLAVRSKVGNGTTFTAWLRVDLAGPVRVAGAGAGAGEPAIQVHSDVAP